MIVGHIPAGYIAGHFLQKWVSDPIQQKRIMKVSLVGSILPDVDMLYFYWVDKSHDHHIFYSHIPACYAVLIPVFVLGRLHTSLRSIGNLAITLWFALMLHAVLDTVVSGILWQFPFVARHEDFLIHIVDKKAIPNIWHYKQVYLEFFGLKLEGWVFNLLVHWSAILEYGICAFALCLLRKRKKTVNT